MEHKGKNWNSVIYEKISYAIPPEYKTKEAAGADLCASISGHIDRQSTQVIPTNIRLYIPKGHVGMICSRSGLAAKESVFVLNSPGIIDSDYRGEIKVILHNAGEKPFVYNVGDRIAQIVFVPYTTMSFVEGTVDINSTERGENGLGSTGKL